MSNISDGGACSLGIVSWTGLEIPADLAIPANATISLTYDYVVPAAARPGTTFDHHAGVRTYQSDDNAGGAFTYIPANNIDGTLVANTAPADDPTSVSTLSPTITYTATSDDINQTGNLTGAANATIGERIFYTAIATIPQGTTLQDASGPATFTIPVGSKQTYVPGSATFALNGLALPVEFTTSDSGNTITVTLPANYVNASGSGADLLQITYHATVDNIAANKRTAGQALVTSATLRYEDGAGTEIMLSAPRTHTIVEPNLAVAKTTNDADGRVSPGQIVRYTVTLTNPTGTRISAANDVVMVDTIPAGVTPVDALGVDVPNGGNVQPSAGVWDSTARTITFAQEIASVGGSYPFTYDIEIDDPQVGNASKLNTVVATATSYPSASTLYGTERDAATATAQSAVGYNATANRTVQLIGASLTKAVDAATATVGQQRIYTLDVSIPASLDLYDVTVRDLLPDGMDYEPGSFAAVCVGGCGLTATAITPTANGDGSTQLGFFIGDLSSDAAVRVVRITYTAHVDDQREPEAVQIVRGNTLQNTAVVYSNQTDVIVGTPVAVPAPGGFSDAGSNQTATVTVTEPTLTIDKDVSGQTGDTDTRNAQPGASLTYTVAVANTGNHTAYDVVIADLPDAELIGVTTAAGTSTTALVDGWTALDPDLRWDIASIAAGATVTFTYSADLADPADLHEADQAVNSADVTAYFAIPEAERTGQRLRLPRVRRRLLRRHQRRRDRQRRPAPDRGRPHDRRCRFPRIGQRRSRSGLRLARHRTQHESVRGRTRRRPDRPAASELGLHARLGRRRRRRADHHDRPGRRPARLDRLRGPRARRDSRRHVQRHSEPGRQDRPRHGAVEPQHRRREHDRRRRHRRLRVGRRPL